MKNPPTCPCGSYNLAHCLSEEEARALGGRWEGRAIPRLGRNGALRPQDEAVAIAQGHLVLPRGQAQQDASAFKEEIRERLQAAALLGDTLQVSTPGEFNGGRR